MAVPDGGGWSTGRVDAVTEVAQGVRLVQIGSDVPLPAPPPGGHLKLRVLIDGAVDVRHYSIVRATPSSYAIAVRLMPDSRGGSRYVHALRPGAVVLFTGPHNLFSLSWGHPQYLLVAGGIGVTPLVGMADVLRRRGADYRLVYAGRSRAGMPFLDELQREHGERLTAVVSDEGGSLDLAGEFAALHAAAEVYLCGPMRMQEAAGRAWTDAGRPAARLRFETFANSGEHEAEAFYVTVDDVGTRVLVPPTKSMLDALTEAGVDMMYSCRRGECGLCAVTVTHVEGAIDHRDVFLGPEQRRHGRRMCTCVSRVVGGGVAVDTGWRATVEPLSSGGAGVR